MIEINWQDFGVVAIAMVLALVRRAATPRSSDWYRKMISLGSQGAPYVLFLCPVVAIILARIAPIANSQSLVVSVLLIYLACEFAIVGSSIAYSLGRNLYKE